MEITVSSEQETIVDDIDAKTIYDLEFELGGRKFLIPITYMFPQGICGGNFAGLVLITDTITTSSQIKMSMH